MNCKKPHADEMIPICAFRYAMGRRTYMVSVVVEWLIANWDKFSNRDKVVIKRDLRADIKQDDESRRNGNSTTWHPLGDNCDRSEWLKLMENINKKSNSRR